MELASSNDRKEKFIPNLGSREFPLCYVCSCAFVIEVCIFGSHLFIEGQREAASLEQKKGNCLFRFVVNVTFLTLIPAKV